MQRSENIQEIATALSKAQSKMALAERDTKNPFYNSTYADLASVWEACRVPLTENGLSVVQFPAADGNLVTVHTMLMHTSGQWFSSTLTVVSKKDDAQGIGSCITYLRRYSLQSMVGVAPDDDDGNASVGGVPQQQQRPAPKKKDESKPSIPPLTDEEVKYVADASNSIILAETPQELRAIGEVIGTKSEAVKNHLRPVFQSRLKVLETTGEAAKSETSAA